MIRRFAKPYAQAMMEITGTAESARTHFEEASAFERLRAGSSELQDLFANPGVEIQGKLDVLGALARRLSLSALTTRLLEVVVRNHRMNDLASILEAWKQMINASLGITVAQVRSAHELSEEEKLRLRGSLEQKLGKQVELELATDPELLGGFVAKVGSEIWDASLVGRINKIRQTLR